jgi:hypothetical protein
VTKMYSSSFNYFEYALKCNKGNEEYIYIYILNLLGLFKSVFN